MASAPGGPAGWAHQPPPAASAATNGAHTELAVREDANGGPRAGPDGAHAAPDAARPGSKGPGASPSPEPPSGLSSAGEPQP